MRLALKTASSRSAEELLKACFLPICAASAGAGSAAVRLSGGSGIARLLGVPTLTPAVSGAELSPCAGGHSAASSSSVSTQHLEKLKSSEQAAAPRSMGLVITWRMYAVASQRSQ